jgi:DNA-binding transcriptional ArsR family regulator
MEVLMDRQHAVAQLKALGEPNRLDLFLQLSRGEMGGSDLLRTSGLSQPSLSRHVRVLREAGVIEERWAGRSAYYRLTDDPLTRSIVGILGGADPSLEMTPAKRASNPKHMSDHESNATVSPADPEESESPPPMEDWLL